MKTLLYHNQKATGTLANLSAGGRLPHALLVEGPVPHSVWNGTDSTTVMFGISVHPASYSERMPRAESAGQAESAKPAGPTDCTEPMKSTEDM